MDLEKPEQNYGKIILAEIIYYYKYTFHIRITTEKHILILETDGDKNEIYRYHPLSTNWNDHMGIIIELDGEDLNYLKYIE